MAAFVTELAAGSRCTAATLSTMQSLCTLHPLQPPSGLYVFATGSFAPPHPKLCLTRKQRNGCRWRCG